MFSRRFLFPAFALLASAGCSGEQDAVSATQLSGGEAFMQAVEDARRYVSQGDLVKAGQSYDEAIELEPENPGLWVDIARLRFLGGEHLTAIEASDFALELGPNYGPALLLRAQMVRDANGLEESLPWFEAASAVDPGNAEILSEYAATLGDLGYHKDMLAAVRDVTELAPGEPQALYLQAVLAARAGKLALSSRLLERSRYLQNGVPSARLLDAIIDMNEGSFDTAANTLETLADEQPGNLRVQELLAKAWWMGSRDYLIVARFAEVASGSEASSYLTMLVGRAFERLGDRKRAIPYIERASARDDETGFVMGEEPSLPQVTNRLRALAKARNLNAARQVSSSFLRQYPQSGDAHSLAGDVALVSANPLPAIELYQVSAQVRRSWPLTRKLASAMVQAGEGTAAKALLARYVNGDPQNLDALIVLAKLSADEGDWLRVQVLLDTAIAQGGGSDPAVLSLRARAARELGNEEDAAQAEALLADTLPKPFL